VTAPPRRPDFAAVLAARATVRDFATRPLPAVLVRRVLELGCRAPSEFNLQPWRILVCRARRDRRRLRACCLDQAQVEAAGVDFVVFGSRRDLRRRAARAAADLEASGRSGGRSRPELVAFVRDCYADPRRAQASALRNAVILAHHLLVAGLALGLDGFWLAGVDEPRLRRSFRVPDELVLGGVIGLGWAARPPVPRRRRPLRQLMLVP
jgi:nitroreductase